MNQSGSERSLAVGLSWAVFVLLGVSPGLAFGQAFLDNPTSEEDFFWNKFAAVGDLDGDSVEDLVVANVGPNPDECFVFSGASSTLLFTLEDPTPGGGNFGSCFAALGDVNGDGAEDVAVGAPAEAVDGRGMQGRVFIFSGRDGELLDNVDDPTERAGATFGGALAVLNNVDGEPRQYLAAGAPNQYPQGVRRTGQVFVFRLEDGSLLHTLQHPELAANANFGWALASLGDIDGDDVDELAVGAPGTGQFFVFLGASGELYYTVDDPTPDTPQFGRVLARLDDLDGDLQADFAVWDRDPGEVDIFSGEDGRLVTTLTIPSADPDADFGTAIVAVGDLDGDAVGDFAVGAPGQDVGGRSNQGRVFLYAGASRMLLRTLDRPEPEANAGFGASLAVLSKAGSPYRLVVGDAYRTCCGSKVAVLCLSPRDMDCDGVPDETDDCHEFPNPDQADADEDGVGDVCDNCPADTNPGQADGDLDGVGDLCDNCSAVSNSNQLDTDSDTLGDACDSCPNDPLNDLDSDGVCGDIDNCPGRANEQQQDTNADGVGDACQPPSAPTGLAAEGQVAREPTILVSWDANAEADLEYYRVYRSEVSEGDFAPIADRLTEPEHVDAGPGIEHGITYYYRVTAIDVDEEESEMSSEAHAISTLLAVQFLRGDCNDDGAVDLSDAISTLGSLFLSEGDPGCLDACDSNDDGRVDISDAIATLGVLFVGNGVIPPPGTTECGIDPTDDEVGCETFSQCP